MAIRKSILMLGNTNTKWNVVGDPIRGNAYYGYGDGVCTIQTNIRNFVGGFGIQATLALVPDETDWFWIKLNPNGDTNFPYITFPLDPYAPTGSNGGDTSAMAFTFIGNFVFLRAVMTRDYIPPTAATPQGNAWTYGAVDKVLLSL